MNRRSARNRHRRRMRERYVISTHVIWHSPDRIERVTEHGSIGVVDFMPLPHIIRDRPIVRIRYEDGAEDVAELHTEHPMLTGTARIE